jgi:hypothetical protein
VTNCAIPNWPSSWNSSGVLSLEERIVKNIG